VIDLADFVPETIVLRNKATAKVYAEEARRALTVSVRGVANPLCLPRRIERPQFGAMLGAYAAEGDTYINWNGTQAHSGEVGFACSEPVVSKLVLDEFAFLGIPKKRFKWLVFLNRKFSKIPRIEEKALCFWSQETGLRLERVWPTSIMRTGSESTKLQRQTAACGAVRFAAYSQIMRQTVGHWINAIPEEMTKQGDAGFAKEFLAGYFAGDGSVSSTRNEARIFSNDPKLLSRISRLLEAIEIQTGKKICSQTTRTHTDALPVYGRKNLEKLIGLGILKYAPVQEARLWKRLAGNSESYLKTGSQRLKELETTLAKRAF
jgi:hypothetical protein